MRRLFFTLLFSFEASSGLFCGREGRRLGNVACVGWAILRVSWECRLRELGDIACVGQ